MLLAQLGLERADASGYKLLEGSFLLVNSLAVPRPRDPTSNIGEALFQGEPLGGELPIVHCEDRHMSSCIPFPINSCSEAVFRVFKIRAQGIMHAPGTEMRIKRAPSLLSGNERVQSPKLGRLSNDTQ